VAVHNSLLLSTVLCSRLFDGMTNDVFGCKR